ncbi:MAG: GNAT family N-acetyltransferase [Pseudomonadota bacterium]
MDIRPYDPKRDLRAVERIWYECGWVSSPEEASYIKDFLGTGRCIVGCLNDTAECQVHTVPGTIRYLDDTLSLSAVTAVTTSRIARKQGFARVMTAQQLAAAAADGAQVAALGMFEQGFYDQVGFGTGSYENRLRFDPATLLVDVPFRVPSRLHTDDWPAVHRAMTHRLSHHGAVNLEPPELMKAELAWTENHFGLGYYEGEALTHFIWGEAKDEHGPYEITAMAYRSVAELLELLALIRSLGDQVNTFVMQEPPHVQLQTLLKQPFRTRRNTSNSAFENTQRAVAWWQVRLLDLPACLPHRSFSGEAFEFNLELEDPAASFLADTNWQGAGGEFTVRIGSESSARPGLSARLPLLKASVNSFSRLFFGIASATQLGAGADFLADPALTRRLDDAFCLPRMQTSWDF